jgi:hypothetical protein
MIEDFYYIMSNYFIIKELAVSLGLQNIESLT